MKKIILLQILLLAGAAALSAQQTIYVVDNVTVEHFDGSQLVGKTVKDYKITTSGAGRRAVTVHAITTSPAAAAISGPFRRLEPLQPIDSSVVVVSKGRKVVYIVDGVEHKDLSALKSLAPLDIESITVLKEGSPEQIKYGEGVGVVKITTKRRRTDWAEFLRSLPGVTVGSDGEIVMNGRPVRNIIVNGRSISLGEN